VGCGTLKRRFLTVVNYTIFAAKFSIAPSRETTDRIKKVRGAKMVRTFSIAMPSMVGIVGRAPAVDEKV